ncbi:hypothetical protein WJX72_007887 [[Myrmecia] bisecta]|uniref:Uncharacterized protein n=1 Tax=[Myrmecia] bisecta TaxID=41462 RepID=A0AAW1Q0I8_9CHLO
MLVAPPLTVQQLETRVAAAENKVHVLSTTEVSLVAAQICEIASGKSSFHGSHCDRFQKLGVNYQPTVSMAAATNISEAEFIESADTTSSKRNNRTAHCTSLPMLDKEVARVTHLLTDKMREELANDTYFIDNYVAIICFRSAVPCGRPAPASAAAGPAHPQQQKAEAPKSLK